MVLFYPFSKEIFRDEAYGDFGSAREDIEELPSPSYLGKYSLGDATWKCEEDTRRRYLFLTTKLRIIPLALDFILNFSMMKFSLSWLDYNPLPKI